MKKLFILSSVFFFMGCSSSVGRVVELYEADAVLTTQADVPWGVGERVRVGNMPIADYTVLAYRIFLGVSKSGNYLVQDFYLESNLKATDPYQVSNIASVTQSFYNPSGLEGWVVRWHQNGLRSAEVYWKNEQAVGHSRYWHENGQLRLDEYSDEEGNAIKYTTWDADGRMKERYYLGRVQHFNESMF